MHFKCGFDTRPPTSSQVCPRLARCRPPDGRASPQLATRPHDQSEPDDNRDLRPTLQPQAAIRTCRSPPPPDRDRTSRPLSSNQGAHTSSLPRPGPFPTSSSRELIQPMVQCKVKAAITTYQRQEKEKCVSSCDSASCSTNGRKVASSPFLIFGTPTPKKNCRLCE